MQSFYWKSANAIQEGPKTYSMQADFIAGALEQGKFPVPVTQITYKRARVSGCKTPECNTLPVKSRFCG